MADCFISYSGVDKELAEFVDKELKSHGITSFMASDSLQPGQNWQQEILENLKNSKWVVLLASRAACSSAFVNQEIGVALHDPKNLIPIVWDMDPSELPAWLKSVQAIDMREQLGRMQSQIVSIASVSRKTKPSAIDLGAVS